jgi:LacI family transcriptional regulator
MVKLAEIAKEAGFSVPVVSRALSPKPHKDTRMAEETRQHIREVARRMGYRPNRNAEFLKRGKNPVIGVFLPLRNDSLLAQLMKGIAEEAEKQNFPLSFFYDTTKESYLKFIRQAEQSQNCGIITYPYFKMDQETADVVSQYQASGGKMVLIEGASQDWQWHDTISVSIDDYHGGKIAAQHLLAQGAEMFLTVDYEYLPERISGFVDTVSKASKPVEVRGENSVESIIKRTCELLKKYPRHKVAIFVPRDPMAVTLLCGLLAKGVKVGQDALIIGFDGQYLTEFMQPALTTVSQPFEEVGRLAAQKLIAAIYGKKIESELIKPKLIIRESA